MWQKWLKKIDEETKSVVKKKWISPLAHREGWPIEKVEDFESRTTG